MVSLGKKCSRMVVVQGGLVGRFGAVGYAASLATMPALVRKVQNHLIQPFLM